MAQAADAQSNAENAHAAARADPSCDTRACLQSRISFRRAPGDILTPPNEPIPPAFETFAQKRRKANADPGRNYVLTAAANSWFEIDAIPAGKRTVSALSPAGRVVTHPRA